MQLRKSDFSILKAASKDESRYNLNAVRFESDGRMVATDGHMLVTFAPPEETQLGEAFEVGAADFARLAKLIDARDAAEIDTEATRANGHVRVNAAGQKLNVAKREDSEFPEWRKLFTTCDGAEGEIKVTLGARLLKTLCEIALAHSGEREAGVTLRLNANNLDYGPMRVDVDPGMTALLMPMRHANGGAYNGI
jgi:DNA polymerase III sliding clamp (beta) subunit (PCNA family)